MKVEEMARCAMMHRLTSPQPPADVMIVMLLLRNHHYKGQLITVFGKL